MHTSEGIQYVLERGEMEYGCMCCIHEIEIKECGWMCVYLPY